VAGSAPAIEWEQNASGGGTKKEQIGIVSKNQYLASLAKTEQKRYKNPGTPDYPVFVDDQGVMYHGSELVAAC
jgi:hypothetical protein